MDVHVLHDGREVGIGPIRADDGARLQASHARLSPESRYRRFLGPKPTLSSADVRYLVEIDGSAHFALVGLSRGEPGARFRELGAGDEQGSIIAVARFIRVPDDPDTAELDVVRRGPVAEVEVELPAMIAVCAGS